MKFCPNCGKKLPIDAFGKNRSRYDGLQSYCRKCRCQQDGEYYKANRKKISRRVERYLSTIEGYLQKIFSALKYRCDNPDCMDYRYYGGRGIQNKFESLDRFRKYVMEDLGFADFEQIKGLQIDRIDNDGHYEKGNVRFVTCKENSNNRRNSR